MAIKNIDFIYMHIEATEPVCKSMNNTILKFLTYMKQHIDSK